jgi:glycosyltransferase involved in cell wall biosynthesis
MSRKEYIPEPIISMEKKVPVKLPISDRETKKPNVAVVTWPIHKSGIAPLQNLVNIISQLSSELQVFTGAAGDQIILPDQSGIQLHLVKNKPSKNYLTRLIHNAFMQLQLSWQLLRTITRVDFYLFFTGGALLLFPMLIVKFCRKKVILNLIGHDARDAHQQMGGSIGKLARIVMKMNLVFADRIILYSDNLITEWDLSKHKNKIYIAHEHYFELNRFKVFKLLTTRPVAVGYFGRLSKEKGILNLVEAIPYILKKENKIEFHIGGDGELLNEIRNRLASNNLNHNVNLYGWIPHDELPDHLNNLKLIVLPSYTEGLPNIMLEAMACGTPVLSTAVGAIPGIIKDGETGFIMANNSAECIADNILRVLHNDRLEQIANNARSIVENEYTFESAVERFRILFFTMEPH